MFNYNICSDCEVNNGCNVTCSTGNFAAMLSLSRAPSKQTRSHKGNYDPSNAAVSHCNISAVYSRSNTRSELCYLVLIGGSVAGAGHACGGKRIR